MSHPASEWSVHAPGTLKDALEFLHAHRGEGWRPLAGGTDALVPLYRDGAKLENPWLSLHRLQPELSFIRIDESGTHIGAMSAIADLGDHAGLTAAYPLFRAMCREFASPAIRNRATVAGNIANASPASDLAPILLVHDAELELASARGVRRVALESFWTGYKTDVLEPDELIACIHLPRPGIDSNRHVFRKVAPRASNSIAIVNFAARGTRDETGRWADAKLAFGCMGPFTKRARAAESVLAGRRFEGDCRAEVLAILERELQPISDHRASAEYRSQAGRNLAAGFLAGSIGESGS